MTEEEAEKELHAIPVGLLLGGVYCTHTKWLPREKKASVSVCVCIISYMYLFILAPLLQEWRFVLQFFPNFVRLVSPATTVDYHGTPYLLPPNPPNKGKEKKGRKENKGRKEKKGRKERARKKEKIK